MFWAAAPPLAAVVLALASGGPAGGAVEQRCGGRPVNLTGTGGPDLLVGTPRRDVVDAGAGDDSFSGLAGSDLVCGGPGDDVLGGAAGSDRIYGGSGKDVISGGTGSDVLRGESGADLVAAGRGNDVADGGGGDGDIALGELGDDRVLGGNGDRDEVSGGLGIDTVRGGPGDLDLVSGDYGYDFMDGGTGNGDIASFASATRNSAGDGGARSAGVVASLRTGFARGDGRDRMRRLESLEGSPFEDVLEGDRHANLIESGAGDDELRGGPGRDVADGGVGIDACRNFAKRISCGREPVARAPAYVAIDVSPAGGGGLFLIGGRRDDAVTIDFDLLQGSFLVESNQPLGIGDGCLRVGDSTQRVACRLPGRALRVVADLGPGDDELSLSGDYSLVGGVRATGGPGADVLRGSAAGDLLEAGAGADRLFGLGGSDGLVGGIPGPDRLAGGAGGDLLAAGGACVGGVMVGGPGRDNASFAETPAHPGVLFASLAAGEARIDAIRGCRPVGIHSSAEDLEGSFDWDILVGDGGNNNFFGQPGRDRFFGRGGDDIIDARDGERDFRIHCGPGDDLALGDRSDPPPSAC